MYVKYLYIYHRTKIANTSSSKTCQCSENKMILNMNYKNIVQCTLIGDGMVGKTCLAKVFAGHPMTPSYISTVFDNYAGNTSVDGEQYTISVFDSTGEHDFQEFRALSYRHSEVCVVCYSVADKESYDSVKNFWLPEIIRCKRQKLPVVLVATQTDFRQHRNIVTISKEKGHILAKQIGANDYIECSMLNSASVETVFEHVVASALKHRKKKHRIMHRILGI